MPMIYGATCDLEKVVSRHLFVICSNNSGSTFLKKALATSRRTWNLAREGQRTFGFAGPSSFEEGLHRHWATDAESISIFAKGEFDWTTTRRARYFQAYSASSRAPVFVEKSPPFLLLVDQLVEHFRERRFLFVVRNPYAMVEGLIRKSGPLSLQAAAHHAINCLRYQRRNIEDWGDRSVFFSYETMCDEPERVAQLIHGLVPELSDLTLRQRLEAWEYDEELRNMNDQQIARLSKDALAEINEVFSRDRELLDSFQYPRM
jgi:hypothetical protein